VRAVRGGRARLAGGRSLAARHREQAAMSAIVRWRAPGVEAVELWDALVDGKTLWDWQREAPGELPEVLGRLFPTLLRGEAAFEDGRRQPPLGDVRHVHATGGLINRWSPRVCLPGTQVPLTVNPDVFAPAAAGEVIAAGALVVDVGQTALKLVWGGRRWHHPRDFAALPIASALPPDRWARSRQEVIEFVAGAIRQVAGRPPALVLALPCALDDQLVASGCSYPYPKPDPALVADLVAASGLDVPTFVLNDAELAAVAAARDPLVPRAEPTLVLTIGFGVGAALLGARS
jgi:hypothetical protein